MELKSYLLTAQALGLRGVLVSLGRTVCRQAAHLLDDLRGREPSAQAPKCFRPTLNSQVEAGAPRGQERVGTGEGEDARFPQDTEPPHSQHLAHMRPGDHAGQAAMGGEGGRVAQALSPAGPHVSGGWTRLGAGFDNQAHRWPWQTALRPVGLGWGHAGQHEAAPRAHSRGQEGMPTG